MIEIKEGILINPSLVFKVTKLDIAQHYELNIFSAPGVYETFDYGNNKEIRDEVYDAFHYNRLK